MPTMTGLVENVDGKYITVNGIRFSAFAPTQIKCVPGENVTFEYVEKPGMNKFGAAVVYKNIKGNVYGKGGAGPSAIPTPTYSSGGVSVTSKVGEPILSKDRLILRQNALTAAVNFVTNTILEGVPVQPSDVINVAKIFEAYTSGDADIKEVEDSLNTSSATE